MLLTLHNELGDVVRITPDEVHLNNPDHYEVIYSMGSKYAKVGQFYGALGAGYSTFTAGPAEVHRPRRAKLNPFFSRQSVIKLEHVVQSRAKHLLKIIASKFSRSESVDLHHAFRSISVDVISDYAFGKSYDLLSRDDLGREFFDLTGGIGPTWWVFQQWPSLQALALALPSSIAKKMSKPLAHVLTLLEVSCFSISKQSLNPDVSSNLSSKFWQSKLRLMRARRWHSLASLRRY